MNDQAAEAAAPAEDKRHIKFALDQEAVNSLGDKIPTGWEVGTVVNRIDFIRAMWAVGTYTRAQVTEAVSRLQGEKVAYQIIFSGTKGLAGGPIKAKGEKKAADAPAASQGATVDHDA